MSLHHELKKQFSISIPLIASWLLYGLSVFISTAVMARLGEQPLAAGALVNGVWGVLTVILFGMLNAVSVLVSHEYGANRLERIPVIFGQGLIISVLGSALIMVVMWVLPYGLLAFERTTSLFPLAKQYSHSYLWCTPWLMVLSCLEHLLLGLARTKTSLLIAVIEVPLEIILVYAFVFGKFGFPELGVAGVGAGFTVAYSLTTVVLYFLLRRIAVFQKLDVFSWKKFQWNGAGMMSVLRIGIPIGMALMVEMLAIFFLTTSIAFFGVLSLAAHQIALQFLFFTSHITHALSQTVSIRVSYFLGEQSPDRLKTAILAGCLMGLMFAVMLSGSYLLFPDQLLMLDLGQSEKNRLLVDASRSFLIYLSAFQFFDSLRIVFAGALRGLQDTKMSMMISGFGFLCLGTLLSSVFGFALSGGSFGCWMGMAAGVLCSTLLLGVRLKQKMLTC